MLTEKEQENGEELLPFKYILHRSTGLSGITPRDGLIRQCAYLYLFKNYGVKDWMSFLDRYGIPMRIGKYSPAASVTAVDVLKRAVMGLGSDAAALIADATTIEVLDLKNAGTDMFERAQEHLAKKIDKVVLGHSGAAESTPGKLGNEDQAEEVQQILMASDAHELEQTIREQLLYPFVSLNFGEECPVPKFVLDTEPPEDTERTARVISSLAAAGLTSIPLAWLHDKFGIPQPTKGEQTLADLRPQFSGLPLKQQVPLSELKAVTGQLIDLLPEKPVEDSFDTEMKEVVDVLMSVDTLAEAEEVLSKRFADWTESELSARIEKGLLLIELAGRREDISR
jgi:phage gp29-like protein